jgi:hypothetical protein
MMLPPSGVWTIQLSPKTVFGLGDSQSAQVIAKKNHPDRPIRGSRPGADFRTGHQATGFHKRLGSGFEQQSPCEGLGGSSRSALMPEISNCD